MIRVITMEPDEQLDNLDISTAAKEYQDSLNELIGLTPDEESSDQFIEWAEEAAAHYPQTVMKLTLEHIKAQIDKRADSELDQIDLRQVSGLIYHTTRLLKSGCP